jgi:hypothetical protein
MFSHIVIFWTKADRPNATSELIEGAQRYLSKIPGVINFHVGKMSPSDRPVVEQSYQVGLNITFADKQAETAYQVHELHTEFLEKSFKPNCERVVVYDFDG